MNKLIRYLIGKRTQRQYLPQLKRSYKNPFDSEALTPDEELILLKGIVRDPHEANGMMQKYGTASAPELFRMLPPPRRSTFRDRLDAWLRLVEGSYETDPHLREWQEAKELYGSSAVQKHRRT
jgi:hypothetical protein